MLCTFLTLAVASVEPAQVPGWRVRALPPPLRPPQGASPRGLAASRCAAAEKLLALAAGLEGDLAATRWAVAVDVAAVELWHQALTAPACNVFQIARFADSWFIRFMKLLTEARSPYVRAAWYGIHPSPRASRSGWWRRTAR